MPKSKIVFCFVMGAACAFSGCARAVLNDDSPSQTCPQKDLGETTADCPWAQWVREVELEPSRATVLPEVISNSIALDARDSAIHEAWGLSLNFDSGAKAEIVKTPLLQQLANRFGVDLVTENGVTRQHAGLIHTYGYLLSNLRTPFGYKRARWVSGTVDRGLSLPEGTLGPVIQGSSTLLSRATYLFMRVALHQDPQTWKKWRRRLRARSTTGLHEIELQGIQRNEELFFTKNGEKVALVTDLVPLPRDPQGGKLLIYSVRRGGRVQIITGFPVDSKFQEKPGAPVRPRYNAWIE